VTGICLRVRGNVALLYSSSVFLLFLSWGINLHRHIQLINSNLMYIAKVQAYAAGLERTQPEI
jgi:hypothetical protein